MARQSALDDAALIRRAQDGSVEAAECLLERYATKIKAIARSFPIPGCEIEDREVECRIATLKAIRTFDADRGAKFSTWVRALCLRRLISMYRSIPAPERRAETRPCSLESEIGEDGFTLAEIVADDVDFELQIVERIDAVNRMAGACTEPLSESDTPIEAWAREAVPTDLFPAVVELLRDDPLQPRLFRLGPSPDSEVGRSILRDLVTTYNESVWHVLCLVAEGYTAVEISEKVRLPSALVKAMIKASMHGRVGVM